MHLPHLNHPWREHKLLNVWILSEKGNDLQFHQGHCHKQWEDTDEMDGWQRRDHLGRGGRGGRNDSGKKGGWEEEDFSFVVFHPLLLLLCYKQLAIN